MESLTIVSRFSSLASRASSAQDFCRLLVHDEVLGTDAVGAQIFGLSDRGVFHPVGSYGVEGFDQSQPISQFAENPLADAVRSREIQHSPLELPATLATGAILTKPLLLRVLPLIKYDLPIGAISSIAQTDSPSHNLDAQSSQILSNIGGLYLSSLGLKNLYRESSGTREDLTERQYEVLMGLARGNTNGEIAKQLILSESSIKAETIRIYKALGVGTREQAVAKARATGLIPDSVAPLQTKGPPNIGFQVVMS
jgi:DNA-binding CsgD family transcriptional regulator